MSNTIKCVEFRRITPIELESRGQCLTFEFEVRGNQDYIDLKSLKYNFEYNKYFENIMVIIDGKVKHHLVYPNVLGNKSPYHFINDKEWLVPYGSVIRINFIRNSEDYDMTYLNVSCNLITDDKMPSSRMEPIPRFTMAGLNVKSLDKYMYLKLLSKPTEFDGKIKFVGFETSGKTRTFTDEITLLVEDRFNHIIYERMKLGYNIDYKYIDGNELYIKVNRDGIDDVKKIYFIMYY